MELIIKARINDLYHQRTIAQNQIDSLNYKILSENNSNFSDRNIQYKITLLMERISTLDERISTNQELLLYLGAYNKIAI